MEKMKVKEATKVRAELYDIAIGALEGAGYSVETIKGGALITLPDGYFSKMNISICDAEKFDVEQVRADYQEKLARDAERAAKAAEDAAEKERKAAEKAAKAAKV